MSTDGKTDFSKKHEPGTDIDPAIAEAVRQRGKNGELACAIAFAIAESLGEPPLAVGKTADLIHFRLTLCQMGLFGYQPKKKIVIAAESVSQPLVQAIQDGLCQGRLPCQRAWEIARRMGLSKMAVSRACEALGIKIKPCQLGAF
jgi:hypothetical protein